MDIRFLLFFYILPPAGIETCSEAVCQNENQIIRFPFRIQQSQQQPKSCGYPGFDVSCSEQGQTLLKLPYSGGEFSIQGIDYVAQQLWINDPINCLPKRILSLNLTGSPFSGVYYQDFSFFNCSSQYLKYRYTPIACLSDSKHTVFATSSRSVFGHLSAVCSFVATVKVPVQQPFYQHVLSSDLSDDLRLSWDSPPCGRCESRGGRCGFKINSTADIACSYFPSQGTLSPIHPNALPFFYCFSPIIIIIIIIITFIILAWVLGVALALIPLVLCIWHVIKATSSSIY